MGGGGGLGAGVMRSSRVLLWRVREGIGERAAAGRAAGCSLRGAGAPGAGWLGGWVWETAGG